MLDRYSLDYLDILLGRCPLNSEFEMFRCRLEAGGRALYYFGGYGVGQVYKGDERV